MSDLEPKIFIPNEQNPIRNRYLLECKQNLPSIQSLCKEFDISHLIIFPDFTVRFESDPERIELKAVYVQDANVQDAKDGFKSDRLFIRKLKDFFETTLGIESSVGSLSVALFIKRTLGDLTLAQNDKDKLQEFLKEAQAASNISN